MLNMTPSRKKLSLAVAMTISANVFAQEVAMHQVTVTAKPVIEEVRIDNHGAVSAVVKEQQLLDQNAIDIASALRRTPGVQIARYNPVGAFGGDQGGAVFIRGMGISRPGSEIKTFIDGVPFYMGVWNHPLLDLLPTNGMKSITVYKSPQPHISGDNFASVELETKRAVSEGCQGNVRFSAGTFGTVQEQVDVTGKDGAVDYMFAQGHAQSDGHRPNASGELNNFAGRIGLAIDQQWYAGTTVMFVNNKAKDPGDARLPTPLLAAEYNTQAMLLTAFVSHQHQDWRGELKLYHTRGNGDWLSQPGLDGDTLSHFQTSGLRWKEQIPFGKGGEIIAGLDVDRIAGEVRFNRVQPAPSAFISAPDFRMTSPYLALNQEFAINKDWRAIPSAGIRFYQHNVFGSKNAPHAGISLNSRSLTVFANVSRGIHYPGQDVALLSSLIVPLGNSWQKLGAETADHAEFGVKASLSTDTQFDFSLFRDKIKNHYVFGFPPDLPPPPQFLNFGTYSMRGAELSVRQQLTPDMAVFGGLTILRPEIDTLPYTPKQALTVGINGTVGEFRFSLDAQYQSETRALNRARSADAANPEKVAGFAVASGRLSYPVPSLGKKGELFLAIENLLNRQYAYRPGYPMAGRAAQLGVAASF